MWEMQHRAQGVPEHQVLPITRAQHVHAICQLLRVFTVMKGGGSALSQHDMSKVVPLRGAYLGLFLGCAWAVPGLCLGCAWVVPGLCLGCGTT